jgi:hypothetical protein
VSEKESIIQKIRKLFALAEGNANEHEREIAMRFAMELLSKHNLSVAQLEQEALQSSVCAVEGEFKLERWIQHILDAVCELYYTNYYISARRTAMFVGTPENIAVSIDVASWLIESIRKESNKLYRDNYQRRSFRLGAAWKIVIRAIELAAEETTTARSNGSGGNLVVIRNQLERANEDYLSKLNLRQRKRRRLYIDQESFDSGSDYGAGVALGKRSKRLPQFA